MWAFAAGFIALSQVASSQSTAPVPVLGVQTGIDSNTGARPPRLNIDDLYSRGGPQWDLYVQALSAFQAISETDELSYFQISGIHGLPFLPWNGAEQVSGGPTTGYCPHGEILFATWHRPFVALFEQVLVSHAQRIANRYPSKLAPQYQAAAASLRQPYWDWALDHKLPLAAILPNITINGPNGPSTIRNPLSTYRFQKAPSGAGFGGALATYPETVRCPVEGGTDTDSASSDADLNLPGLALTSQTGRRFRHYSSYTFFGLVIPIFVLYICIPRSDFVGFFWKTDPDLEQYAVFTQSQRYESMASVSSAGPSFEAPHNNIHVFAGCPNGTLADIGWSAFDPLFMLHHANVDRLIAMWQAIYYNDSTMTTTGVSHGTFGTKEGSVVDADSPLKPFFDSKLNYYTSRSASQIKAFGYTYPEINDWSTSPDELAAYVTVRVNDLYGQGRDAGPTARNYALSSGSVDYTAQIQVERSEVPLPCTISLRLGNHVLGRMSLLAMPVRGMSYTSIPLWDALHQLNLKNMPEDTLIPYLLENLEVRVQTSDGSFLSKRRVIPSLRVELQGRDVTSRKSESQLPKYGAARKWPVTKYA